MKKLSQLLLITLFLFSSSDSFSQASKSKDENRIMLTAWVPHTIDGMPVAARRSLNNKLKMVVTKKGLGGSPYNTRFIISANISVETKVYYNLLFNNKNKKKSVKTVH